MNIDAVGAAVALAIAGQAAGQSNAFDIVVSNDISPDHPSATVELWALFEPQWWAFAEARLDVAAAEGTFSDPANVLLAPFSDPGEVSPDGASVLGLHLGQLCDPLGHVEPDASNPILLWRATWATDDFSARAVSLGTATTTYSVYSDYGCTMLDLIDDGFAEGLGQIVVVPSPTALGTLVAACACLASRRRR